MAAQRAYRVKVRAQDLAGQPLTLTLTDWRARIFQHEFDHLQVRYPARNEECESMHAPAQIKPRHGAASVCNLQSSARMQGEQDVHCQCRLF